MPKYSERLDMIFGALSDPTRRAVVARLGKGARPVSDLAKPFDMALPSFTQHLGVLERCGLIKSTKRGRSRIVSLVPGRIDLAQGWLEKQRRMWESRLDRMDSYVLNLKEEK